MSDSFPFLDSVQNELVPQHPPVKTIEFLTHAFYTLEHI